MALTPLHKLAQMVRQGESIDDTELMELLGIEATIAVPLTGGGERRLPSGEILSVLADGAGVTVDRMLSQNFRMSPEEVETAREFIRVVQFAGGTEGGEGESAEQPIQPLDH